VDALAHCNCDRCRALIRILLAIERLDVTVAVLIDVINNPRLALLAARWSSTCACGPTCRPSV